MPNQIDKHTKIPLYTLGIVIFAVAGGASWATRMDLLLTQAREDIAIIKKRLGIETASTAEFDGTGQDTVYDGGTMDYTDPGLKYPEPSPSPIRWQADGPLLFPEDEELDYPEDQQT